MNVNDAAAIAGKHRNVSAFRFARSVHDAAHDGHFERKGDLRGELLFHFLDQCEEVHLDASAGWAGDQFNALAWAFTQAIQDFQAVLHLIHVIACVTDAERVADAVGDQGAERSNGANGAR